jgi:hypothetical protein
VCEQRACGISNSAAQAAARPSTGSAMATISHRGSLRNAGRCAFLAHAPAPRTPTRIFRDMGSNDIGVVECRKPRMCVISRHMRIADMTITLRND